MKTIYTSFLLLFFLHASAQYSSFSMYSAGHNDHYNSSYLIKTNDGGHLLYGNNYEPAVKNESQLYKFSAANTLQWSKTLSTTSSPLRFEVPFTDRYYYALQLKSGNYVIAFNDYFYHVNLVSLDAQGNTLWSKRLGFSDSSSGTEALQLFEAADGSVIVPTLSYYGLSINQFSAVTGASLSTKNCPDLLPVDIKQTADGGYIVSGYKEVNFNLATNKAVVQKVDKDLNVQFEVMFRTPAFYYYGFTSLIQQTAEGNYLVQLTLPDGTIYFVKLAQSGRVIWSRSANQGTFSSLLPDVDGSVVVTGYTDGAGTVARLTSNGSLKWATRVSPTGADSLYSGVINSNKSINVAGVSNASATPSLLVAALSSSGVTCSGTPDTKFQLSPASLTDSFIVSRGFYSADNTFYLGGVGYQDYIPSSTREKLCGSGFEAGDRELTAALPAATSFTVRTIQNPVSGNTLRLSVVATTPGMVQLSFVNLQGIILSRKTMYAQKGTNVYSLDVSALSSGVYNIAAVQNSICKTIRFMK